MIFSTNLARTTRVSSRTNETEGAPRVQYFGHKRYVEARETILGEEDHIHKDQLKLMFPAAQEKGNMKIKGGKPGTSALVYSVQDILNKRDFKKDGSAIEYVQTVGSSLCPHEFWREDDRATCTSVQRGTDVVVAAAVVSSRRILHGGSIVEGL